MQPRMDYDPDENEMAVLEVLREEGRVNPLLVREQTEIRKQYVNDALRQLKKLGIVRKITKGLYEYVPENDDLPGSDSDEDDDREIRTDGGIECGPVLLAWWEDEFSRPWQFIQKRDWFAVRYHEDGEWRYLGDWISYSDRHGTAHCSLQTDTDD